MQRPMFKPRNPPGRPTLSLCFTTLLLATLGGCGHGDSPASPRSRTSRVAMRLAQDAVTVPEPRLVERCRILEEPDRWKIVAPEEARIHVATEPGEAIEGSLVVGVAPEHRECVLRRSGRYLGSSFQRVRSVLMASSAVTVRAEFYRGDTCLGGTAGTGVFVPPRERKVVELEVPRALSAEPEFDAIVLRLEGAARWVSVTGFDLEAVSAASAVPPPGEPELVWLEDQARIARGVARGRALAGDAAVPERARLSFSYAQPEAVRPLGEPSELVLSVRSGELSEHIPIDLAGAQSWRMRSVPLDRFAGRTVELRFELAGGTGDAACLVGDVRVDAGAANRPSVLLVTSDTHRGDHLGRAGADIEIETPVLDALADRGLLFEDCYATTNVTNPSHIALMTARHPRMHGVIENNQPLAGVAPTLAEIFRQENYRTFAAVSAGHLAAPISGLGQGFDRVSWPTTWTRRAGATIDEALAWLETCRGGTPVFLWVHLFDAHHPYAPAAEFDRRYYDADRDPRDPSLPDPGLPETMPPDLVDIRDLEYPRAQYRAEISYLDRELARLFEVPRFENGIIAVVGDHGESLGEHEIYFHHLGLYPQTLHVPLLLAFPDAPQGRRVSLPVQHTDLGRTLLDLAGAASSSFPGRNLTRLLEEPLVRHEPRYALASSGAAASITQDGQHLVLQLVELDSEVSPRRFERHRAELYDLEQDPACEHDLIDERPLEAGRLWQKLTNWLENTSDLGWASSASHDPELIAELGALGYTAGSDEPGRVYFEQDDCEWCRRLR